MLRDVALKHERYLDLLSARQKLLASNLANADTPGYKTRDIDFQREFRRALHTNKEEEIHAGLASASAGQNASDFSGLSLPAAAGGNGVRNAPAAQLLAVSSAMPSLRQPAPWMQMPPIGEGFAGPDATAPNGLGPSPSNGLETETFTPEIIEPDTFVVRNDGNNVNLDREARLLAENSLRFQMVSLMARSKFRGVKKALEIDRGA